MRLFRFTSRDGREVRGDVQDEVAFHLEMRIRDLVAEGLTAEEARATALREFGNVSGCAQSLARHGTRLERKRTVARLLDDIRQDLGYGLRLIVRNKGFSAAAVLTLAVAIGGNTTMFTIVNTLFLQPLVIHRPGELTRIYPGQSTVSWLNIEDIRKRNVVFTDVIAQSPAELSMAADPLPIRISTGLVSSNYFTVLGTSPLIGRTFSPQDRPDVVVLGERFWRARFGASPTVLGDTIVLGGRRVEIIGVMPRAFRGIAAAGFTRDAWLPVDELGAHRGLTSDRTAARFEAFGRLKPGIAVEQAESAMRVAGEQLASEYPNINERFRAMEVFGVSGLGLYRGVGKTLLPVFVFIGFLTIVAMVVLFISCTNLAGLLLGRAAARRQEIAVRLAIGAGRGRLVRQLLTESVVLALLGGVFGTALSLGITAWLTRLAVRLPIPVDLNLRLDWRVLGYTFAVSLACALLFGLAPARRASRASLVEALKVSGGTATSPQRLRHALIVVQVAFSALLLFWSGLFARSLFQVNTVDIGFDPQGVLLSEVQLSDDAPGALERAETALVELQNRVADLPSVQAAGWSTIVPLALTGNERFRVSRADAAQDTPGVRIVASRLTPGWFETVRIPFVAGRDFTWSDRQGSPQVVIVNDTLARLLWSGAAIGQRVRFGSNMAEIVGVVRDSKYWTLGEEVSPTVYLPLRQAFASHPATLHVRTSDIRGTAEGIRRELHLLAPTVAPQMQPMPEAVAAAVIPARVGAVVTGAFGLLGAVLATLGVYGLISYLVVQRAREMAVRRAIGAPSTHIMRVVVGRTAVLALIGLGIGILAAALSAPLFGGLLVNVSPLDPLTVVATIVVVIATAIVASTPPALRAARVDPMGALRAE